MAILPKGSDKNTRATFKHFDVMNSESNADTIQFVNMVYVSFITKGMLKYGCYFSLVNVYTRHLLSISWLHATMTIGVLIIDR